MSTTPSPLAEELDADLELFLKQKIEESKNKPRTFNFDNKSVDEVAEEMKQHPVFMSEFDESKPMNVAVEALQALKYESADHDETALSYKEDGNKNFGRKKYRWAIDNYTAGLSCAPSDPSLTCLLFTNRAAAHFHIGNYRSSINDCIGALKHKPAHLKAWIRAIDSNMRLEKNKEVLEWCDKALSRFPEEAKIIESRHKASMNIKKSERDDRKVLQKMKRERVLKMAVVEAIKKRNIQFESSKLKKEDDEDEDEEEEDGGWLRMVCEEHKGAVVELVEGVDLQWPVMFLYPQHHQSDFVIAFHELSTFTEHTERMFAAPAGWDFEQQYTPTNINIYHEQRLRNGTSHFHLVLPQTTLLQVLCSKTFTLTSSLVIFYIFPKNSGAEEIFLKENNS